MTNGDAIKAILKPRTDQIRTYGDWVEIEIQSLSINFSCELSWWDAEYKPTTKNDLGVDCISRADVKAKKIYSHERHEYVVPVAEIDWLPSVTPQEYKVGRWIFVEGTKGKDNVEKCSCCGSHWKEAVIYRTDTQEYLRTRLFYCPNCGSDNREVEP